VYFGYFISFFGQDFAKTKTTEDGYSTASALRLRKNSGERSEVFGYVISRPLCNYRNSIAPVKSLFWGIYSRYKIAA
jgi:hypothetical protein